MGGKAKVIITVLAVLALAVVGFNAIGIAGQSASQVDISGPCDEAENANDPRCTGQPVGDASPEDSPSPDDSPSPEDSPSVGNGVDISGPCDETEHINDPRCTGAPGAGDNSGPGNGDDDEDNSGPGNGDDDDEDDDNSGPGGGDDDNSGPGSDD